MRVKRIRANKHAELLITGDHTGPSTIHILTKVRPTAHGDLFKELVLRLGPDALKIADADMRSGGHGSPQRTMEAVATGFVTFCEEVTMRTLAAMQRNPALGVSVPSYDALCEKLQGGTPAPGTVVPIK